MKRNLILFMFFLAPALVAGAQENIFHKSTVLRDLNYRNTLWFNSNNASGMGFSPLASYADIDLEWNFENGKFAPAQVGEGYNDVSLKTSGAVALGGFNLWGSFTFQNKFDKNCRYNCIAYEIEDQMPYYVADTTASQWIRQAYELSVKAASPVLWDKVTFGAEVNYDAKVGSKQRDPRCATYKYKVNILPSVTVKLGRHYLGADFIYENGFERSEPTNSNYRFSQPVILTTGLGNGSRAKVGDNDGLATMYYKYNLFGGALQWGMASKDFEILADFGFKTRSLEELNQPRMPKHMGRVEQNVLTLDVQSIFGNDKSNKLSLDADMKMSNGLEPVQSRDDTHGQQQWVLLSENLMSTYQLVDATVSYDHLFGNADPRGYDWKIAAAANFRMQNDNYLLPVSVFEYKLAALSLRGEKQFKLKKSSIRPGVDCKFNKSLGGSYIFGSSLKNVENLQGLYKSDIQYWTSDYVKAGVSLDCDFQLKKCALYFNVGAYYAKPLGLSFNRIAADVKIGVLF